MDETVARSTTADSTANGLTATYSGTLLDTSGPLISAGRSTLFINGSATTASSALIKPGTGGAMSFEAWVRSTAATFQGIISSDNGSGAGRLFQFRLDTTGHVNLIVFNATGASNVTGASTGTVNDGNIHHVVATYDGANIRCYIDGAASGVTACTLVGSSTSHALAVGNNLAGISAGPFSGSLDEVAFYTYALSPTQVSAHFAAGGSPPATTSHLSQVAIEVLRQSNPPASAGLSQMAVEVLVPVIPYLVDIEMI